MSLGILIMEFPYDETPGQISYNENNVLNLASHVATLYRHRREKGEERTEPYFLEVNDVFKQRFPLDKALDCD